MRTTHFLLLVPTLVLAGCGGSADEQVSPPQAVAATQSTDAAARPVVTQAPSSVTTIPKGPWTDLARRLVESRNIEAAVTVTREVLARGGVATHDGERAVVPAIGPAATFTVMPLETVHLAMEARNRATSARLTAAELAQMLETFGWPFPGGTPGGGNAHRLPLGPAADPEAARASELAERNAREAAERAENDAVEAEVDKEREASRARVDAAQQRVNAATTAWQKARQAVSKAPADEKAAAEAQVKAAWDARGAAIQDLGAVRKTEDEAEDERRTRATRARETADRLRAVQRKIGSDFRAGDHLLEMLAVWVRGAAERPDDPRSFTPLFLAEMARLQDPPFDVLGSRFQRPGRGDGAPVDLRGGPRSGQLRLTLLEIELMAAAFYRGPAASASDLPRRPEVLLARYAPAAQEPCTQVKESMGELGEVAEWVAGQATGDALGAAIEAATNSAAAEAFGNAMSAIGMAGKIAKLVSFYADEQITVTPDERMVHKQTSPGQLVAFKGTAGISDDDWAEYQRLTKGQSKVERATRDCLERLGMPSMPDMSDLLEETKDWLIEWRLVEGAPPHAYYSLKNNEYYLPGRQAMKLFWRQEHSASALFVVDIVPEREHRGKVVRAYVTARASVDAAGMPSIGTFLNPLTGVLGLIDSLVDLGAGWFQTMFQPKAYGTVEVEYHCPKPTTLHNTRNPMADGGGEGPDDCLIAAEAGR